MTYQADNEVSGGRKWLFMKTAARDSTGVTIELLNK
jgi:hypothetical protein